MTHVNAMLFDLDGTLLDSAPDLVAALNWLRKTVGLYPLETEKMSRYVSRGAVGLLTAGMPATNETQFNEWKSSFLNRYAERLYCESRLYEGIPQLLDRLDQERIPWGVVTNKMHSLTLPIMEASGLVQRASCIVSGDTLSLSKPHPDPVLFACKQLGIEPSRTLFAGDDVRDLQAGASAGTLTAAVYYGYGSYEFTEKNVGNSTPINQPHDFEQFLEP